MRHFLFLVILCSTLLGQSPLTFTFSSLVNGRTSPNQIWGTTQHGVYRSDDGGKTFRGVVLRPGAAQQPAIAQIHVDHRNSNTLFVATYDPAEPLLRSTDAGLSWTPIREGLPAALPADGGFIITIHQPFESTETVYVRIQATIYKSTDNGVSFKRHIALPGVGVFYVAPSNSRVMFAGSAAVTSGLSVSNDEGLTWSSLGNLPPSSNGLAIQSASPAIAINPRNANQIFGYFFVAYSDPNSSTGVSNGGAFYTSSDGGKTWTFQSTSTGFVRSINSSADASLLLIGGQFNFRSTDFGVSLTRLTTPGPYFINASNANIVYTASGQVSNDGGRSFVSQERQYYPLFAASAPVHVTLESGTSSTLTFTPRDIEGVLLRPQELTFRSESAWLSGSNSPFAGTYNYRVLANNLSPGEYEGSLEVISPDFPVPLLQLVRLSVRPRIDPQLRYQIRLLAGNGLGQFSGDGGPAAQAGLENYIVDLSWSAGNLYIATPTRVRRVNAAGIIQTVAGSPSGSTSDGVEATRARFSGISSIAVRNSVLYIIDYQDKRLRLMGTDGLITTLATPATGSNPFAFTYSSRIRFNAAGQMFLCGPFQIYRYDGGTLVNLLPNNSRFSWVEDFLVDSQGDILSTDGRRIWRLRPAAPGTTGAAPQLIAGSAVTYFSGDHEQASVAQFNAAKALARDVNNNLFVIESNRLRSILPSGIVQTVAGNGDPTLGLRNGDIANTAGLGGISALTTDSSGNVYVGTNSGQVFVLERVRGTVPAISSGGVVSLAAGARHVAPGAIFSIYGSGLSAATASNGSVPLPFRLGGVQVLVNGSAVPLFYVSPNQVNAQMPYGLAPGPVRVVVARDGTPSAEQSVEIAAAQPDILVYGANRAVAVNQNGTINGEAAPAQPGEFLVVYLTGIGALDVPVAAGSASPSNPLARAAGVASATIGGLEAELSFFGLAPGFVGLAQANIKVPESSNSGDRELVITVSGSTSNRALLRIR